MEEAYKQLSSSEILQSSLIKEILTIENADIRERCLMAVENRARELKVIQNFKRLFKIVQAELIQDSKQIDSLETCFTKAPIKLKCKNYICNDFGITKSEFNPILMRTADTLICTHPLLPVERLINVDTNIEKVKLSFYKDKKWQSVIAERNTLASKNKILQLANTGIEVNENNAKDMITYISDLISINSETIPCNKAVTHLGWVEEGFIPFVEDFKFDGDRSFEGVFKDVKEKGDYEMWKEEIRKLRVENETLHFMIAVAFASPLIEILHINPFIVHLWGKSGTGKTVALMIAMSVWGNPKIGHLVKNLNSTSVGLERLSAFLNNIPFACDELQAIKNKYTNFNELIYSLTQGEGKSRGTIDGGIQEQLKWSCAFLTTGEEPITSETSKEGVKNRVIEIEENKPLIENGKEMVNFLIENHGFAGKEYIENLPDAEYLRKRHKEIFDELEKVNPSTGKQTNAIATVLLADEIISRTIFYDEPLSASQSIKYFQKDIDEAKRIYDLIVDWFISNKNRFKEDNQGEIWGKEIENENGFYVIPKILRDFLSSNNVCFDGVKQKLFDQGYIERKNDKSFTQSARINGNVCKAIKFRLNIEDNKKYENVTEMPF